MAGTAPWRSLLGASTPVKIRGQFPGGSAAPTGPKHRSLPPATRPGLPRFLPLQSPTDNRSVASYSLAPVQYPESIGSSGYCPGTISIAVGRPSRSRADMMTIPAVDPREGPCCGSTGTARFRHTPLATGAGAIQVHALQLHVIQGPSDRPTAMCDLQTWLHTR